jgi:hypothetical protein
MPTVGPGRRLTGYLSIAMVALLLVTPQFFLWRSFMREDHRLRHHLSALQEHTRQAVAGLQEQTRQAIDVANAATYRWAALTAVQDHDGRDHIRQQIDCATIKKMKDLAVIVAFGQSNASNNGQSGYTPPHSVYNYYEGKCYIAADPLLGNTGEDGSLWGRLADRLIERDVFGAVLLVPIAWGGTSVRDWAPGGKVHYQLVTYLESLHAAGLPITYLLWHQGESDVTLPPREYTRYFSAMLRSIRDLGVEAPVYVAQASTCVVSIRARFMTPELVAATAALPPSELMRFAKGQLQIRQQQRELAMLPGVRLGPDTDKIDPAYRYDGCHFGDVGQERHAELWFEALTGKVWRQDDPGYLQYDVVYDKNRQPQFARTGMPVSKEQCDGIIAKNSETAMKQGYSVGAPGITEDPSTGIITRDLCLSDEAVLNHQAFKRLMSTPLDPSLTLAISPQQRQHASEARSPAR